MGAALTGSRPRVCLITESFYPDIIGGLELHAYAVAEGLIARGLPVSVLTRKVCPGAPSFALVGRVPVRRLPPAGMFKGRGWRSLGPMALLPPAMLLWLLGHRGRYDVVVAHGLKVLFLPAVLTSLIASRPCVIKVESPIELEEEISAESLRRMGLSRSSPPVRAWRALRLSLVRRADCLVAISAEIAERLAGMGVAPERIRFIPNGIDVERFRPATPAERLALRRRLGLPPDRTVLTFTGRLSRAKGLTMLLEVWRELVAAGRPLHLVLVGGGGQSFDDCEGELRSFIRAHGLQGTVTLPGTVSNVPEWLQASDLFVFPSDYEGFGLAVLEAMACGLPVVATRVGAVPEAVIEGRHGALADPRSPEQLRAALLRVLEQPARWPAMGEAGRRTVVERYSLGAVTDRYAALLRELTARRSAA